MIAQGCAGDALLTHEAYTQHKLLFICLSWHLNAISSVSFGHWQVLEVACWLAAFAEGRHQRAAVSPGIARAQPFQIRGCRGPSSQQLLQHPQCRQHKPSNSPVRINNYFSLKKIYLSFIRTNQKAPTESRWQIKSYITLVEIKKRPHRVDDKSKRDDSHKVWSTQAPAWDGTQRRQLINTDRQLRHDSLQSDWSQPPHSSPALPQLD